MIFGHILQAIFSLLICILPIHAENYISEPADLSDNFYHLLKSNDTEKISEVILDDPLIANSFNKAGDTPLMSAIFAEDLQIAKLLITSYHADVNAKRPHGDLQGSTALFTAAFSGYLEGFQLLLANGADVNSAVTSTGGMFGCTVLCAAALQGIDDSVLDTTYFILFFIIKIICFGETYKH